MILVYDVSRWGRIQDADESAHYEYICRSAGFHGAYCAEQFENDGDMRLPGVTMREVSADGGRFIPEAKEIRLASGAAFRGKAQLCDGTMARSHLEEVRAGCWRTLGVDAIEVS